MQKKKVSRVFPSSFLLCVPFFILLSYPEGGWRKKGLYWKMLGGGAANDIKLCLAGSNFTNFFFVSILRFNWGANAMLWSGGVGGELFFGLILSLINLHYLIITYRKRHPLFVFCIFSRWGEKMRGLRPHSTNYLRKEKRVNTGPVSFLNRFSFPFFFFFFFTLFV